MTPVEEMQLLFRALSFAAEKHASQLRKGVSEAPYLNHCIRVADFLVRIAGISDAVILAAALLHDTVEDTDTTAEEIEREFGVAVRDLVLELTDDKQLPKQRRKELQIEHAPSRSFGASQIKLSDKLCNVLDVAYDPPPGWTIPQCIEYLDWTERVVDSLVERDPALERLYRETLRAARRKLSA